MSISYKNMPPTHAIGIVLIAAHIDQTTLVDDVPSVLAGRTYRLKLGFMP